MQKNHQTTQSGFQTFLSVIFYPFQMLFSAISWPFLSVISLLHSWKNDEGSHTPDSSPDHSPRNLPTDLKEPDSNKKLPHDWTLTNSRDENIISDEKSTNSTDTLLGSRENIASQDPTSLNNHKDNDNISPKKNEKTEFSIPTLLIPTPQEEAKDKNKKDKKEKKKDKNNNSSNPQEESHDGSYLSRNTATTARRPLGPSMSDEYRPPSSQFKNPFATEHHKEIEGKENNNSTGATQKTKKGGSSILSLITGGGKGGKNA